MNSKMGAGLRKDCPKFKHFRDQYKIMNGKFEGNGFNPAISWLGSRKLRFEFDGANKYIKLKKLMCQDGLIL